MASVREGALAAEDDAPSTQYTQEGSQHEKRTCCDGTSGSQVSVQVSRGRKQLSGWLGLLCVDFTVQESATLRC